MGRDFTDRPDLQATAAAGRNLHQTTAFAIKVGDEWFAGFGMEKDGSLRTKLRRGLFEAKLISGSAPQKVREYLIRLEQRGYHGRAVRVAIDG
jgi:hypothetical protein